MEYGKIYGTSKKATEDVLSWLRSLSSASSQISLSAHVRLAEQAVKDGAILSDTMIDNLRTAIITRQQLADYHASTGDLDEKHMHIIDILGQFYHLFCPEQVPSVLQSSLPEACNEFNPYLYDSAPYVQQQFEQQQYAYPEYYPTFNECLPFYPQPPPPFAPCYPTTYTQEMDCRYFEFPTCPTNYPEDSFQYSNIERRPSPDVKLSPPQGSMTSTMPASPALSTCSSLFSEQDFPALPLLPPSST